VFPLPLSLSHSSHFQTRYSCVYQMAYTATESALTVLPS
jgi:hypothetical protein